MIVMFNGKPFHLLPGGDLVSSIECQPPVGYVKHGTLSYRFCPLPIDDSTYKKVGKTLVAFPEDGKTAPCPPGYVRDENDPDVFHKIGAERDPVCKGCRGL